MLPPEPETDNLNHRRGKATPKWADAIALGQWAYGETLEQLEPSQRPATIKVGSFQLCDDPLPDPWGRVRLSDGLQRLPNHRVNQRVRFT